MRKLLLLLSLVVISVNAQNIEINLTENGAYEKKEVVKVDSTKAIILFERAMIALSDWTGPDGKAKAGIDYQEKETGTVIYKGRYSLGFKNTFLGDGWYRYAEFTLKVRCKDGRAQVTIIVPSITAIYNRNGMTRTNGGSRTRFGYQCIMLQMQSIKKATTKILVIACCWDTIDIFS